MLMMEAREEIPATLHDHSENWDAMSTDQFVSESYWWPRMGPDVGAYTASCDEFQKFKGPGKLQMGLRQPISRIFDTSSLVFSGPFERTASKSWFLLVGVEHFTELPTAWATSSETCAPLINFVKDELMNTFQCPRTVVTDNSPPFVATEFGAFLKNFGAAWLPAMEYIPQMIGRAERIVERMKRTMERVQ